MVNTNINYMQIFVFVVESNIKIIKTLNIQEFINIEVYKKYFKLSSSYYKKWLLFNKMLMK